MAATSPRCAGAPIASARPPTLPSAASRAGDAVDRDRLAGLARRLRGAGDDARADADGAGRAVALHAVTTGAVRAGSDARTWRSRERAGAPLTDAELAAPLPRLLDGGGWTYARVGQPAALLAAGKAVLGRLRYREPAEQYMLSAIADNLASGPLSLLTASGGLDLARPIECGAMALSGDDFVCTVEVADAAALDRALAANPEAIAGAKLPQVAALLGITIGTLAGAGPLLADSALDRDEADDPLSGLAGEPARTILRERVGLTTREAGRELTRQVVVSATDDGRSTIDGPSLLRVGRRLFVFGSAAVARRVLTALPAAGDALADDPVFRRATAGWVDGAAAQAMMLPDGESITEATVFEVAPDQGGIRFRLASLGGTPSRPIAGALAMVPPGASASFGHGGSDRPEASASAMFSALFGAQRWMFESPGETAYAWYPGTGALP
jgi:hypothetical protein